MGTVGEVWWLWIRLKGQNLSIINNNIFELYFLGIMFCTELRVLIWAVTQQLLMVNSAFEGNFLSKIIFIQLGEKLSSVYTDVRNSGILPWIKDYINGSSGENCKKNQNEYDPQIEFLNLTHEKQEEAGVDETARVGHLVSVISVTDLDLEDRGGAVLTITEGNEEGQFSLDSVGGVHVIRVAGRGQLDRETTNQYQLTVQAEDRGTPPRSSTATLTVNIGKNPGKIYKSSLFVALHYINIIRKCSQVKDYLVAPTSQLATHHPSYPL